MYTHVRASTYIVHVHTLCSLAHVYSVWNVWVCTLHTYCFNWRFTSFQWLKHFSKSTFYLKIFNENARYMHLSFASFCVTAQMHTQMHTHLHTRVRTHTHTHTQQGVRVHCHLHSPSLPISFNFFLLVLHKQEKWDNYRPLAACENKLKDWKSICDSENINMPCQ